MNCCRKFTQQADFGGAQVLFHEGPRELDRVHVRRVGREAHNRRASALDQPGDAPVLMRGQAVPHHDIARFEAREKVLLDVVDEAIPGGPARVGADGLDSSRAERGDHRGDDAALARDVLHHPLASRRTCVLARHRGVGSGLIDEMSPSHLDSSGQRGELLPLPSYIGAVLLSGFDRLFFRVMPSRERARPTVSSSTFTPVRSSSLSASSQE